MSLLAVAIGFTIASGIVGHARARRSAREQRRFQALQIKSLGESARTQEATLAINEVRAQQQISQERLEATQEARRLRASSLVGQIESGQTGPSAQRVIDDILRQETNIGSAFGRKAVSQRLSSDARLRGIRAETLSRQNQILSPIDSPSLLASALGIGSSVAQTLVFADAAKAKAAA